MTEDQRSFARWARRCDDRPTRLVYYASYTGTRTNQRAMLDAGIRPLLSPRDRTRRRMPTGYALDNGAWPAHLAGRLLDEDAYAALVRARGRGADWIVLPDIVAGGRASLDLSLEWLDFTRHYSRPLIAVQDGITPEDIEEYVGPDVGIFVGGSTAWKWASLPAWAEMAHVYEAYLHVGRVNGAEAIRACASLGVHSCDGTAATRYSLNAPRLGAAARAPVQTTLRLWCEAATTPARPEIPWNA